MCVQYSALQLQCPGPMPPFHHRWWPFNREGGVGTGRVIDAIRTLQAEVHSLREGAQGQLDSMHEHRLRRRMHVAQMALHAWGDILDGEGLWPSTWHPRESSARRTPSHEPLFGLISTQLCVNCSKLYNPTIACLPICFSWLCAWHAVSGEDVGEECDMPLRDGKRPADQSYRTMPNISIPPESPPAASNPRGGMVAHCSTGRERHAHSAIAQEPSEETEQCEGRAAAQVPSAQSIPHVDTHQASVEESPGACTQALTLESVDDVHQGARAWLCHAWKAIDAAVRSMLSRLS
jgi:hypothetical protein